MRSAPLTTIKGGISRLRTKGGARADTLYDLLNGYVTEAGTVKVRPGTERVATLDPLTRGICAFGGSLHTFCHIPVAVPTGFTLNVICHPDPPDVEYGDEQYYGDANVPLEKIHFAEPFLGGLYVVAEFEDGSIYHYWLQPAKSRWAALTEYASGDLIAPSADNGFLYTAARFGDPYPAWEADAPRYDGVGDNYDQSIVEPTVYNARYYVCVETKGPNPRSGTTEPTWPTDIGLTVTERTDTGLTDPTVIDGAPPPTISEPPASTSGGTVEDEVKYDYTVDPPLDGGGGGWGYNIP
jgi:hypothetical protein